MSSFNITTPEASLLLRPSSVKPGVTATGTATYSVTNRTGATIRTRASVKPGDGAEEGWFSVRGGDERDIGPGATESFEIDLSVPGGTGNYSFHVVAVNTGDPDNDYAEGSAVAFDAPAKEAGGGGLKWWMIAAPIALVAVVGLVIAIASGAFKKEMVTIADFRGSPIEKAEDMLREQGVQWNMTVPTERIPEVERQQFYNRLIVDQTPAPGPESDGTIEIPKSTTVELSWQWSPKKLTVPTNLVNMGFANAVTAVTNAGFRHGDDNGPPGSPPTDLSYSAVGSVSPRGQQDAGTPINFTLVWREAPDRQDWLRHMDAAEVLRGVMEMERNRINIEAIEIPRPPTQ